MHARISEPQDQPPPEGQLDDRDDATCHECQQDGAGNPGTGNDDTEQDTPRERATTADHVHDHPAPRRAR